MQVRLLRVLDGAPFYRVGGRRKIQADVRVVAATNRDLREEVEARRFRGDLYHRICQFNLHVPPLRERPEDIEPLAALLLEKQSLDAKLDPDALAKLTAYSWPGNVRELRNVLLRAALMNDGGTIRAEDLELEPASLESLAAGVGGPLAALEQSAIELALEQTAATARRPQACSEFRDARCRGGSKIMELNRRSAATQAELTDRRSEPREPASAVVSLLFFDPVPAIAEGTLVDRSAGGFRVAHECQDLRAGLLVRFSYGPVNGAARVVWTRRVDGRLESGFAIVEAAEYQGAMR